jgi:hypothetical protein
VRFELTVLGICNPLRWATPPPVHCHGLGSRNRTYAPTSQTSSDTISPYREKLERVGGVEPHSVQLGRLTSHLELTRLNKLMHTYDTLTADGIQIHLSMSNANTGYIIVNDIYDNHWRMFYFVDAESARRFIASL